MSKQKFVIRLGDIETSKYSGFAKKKLSILSKHRYILFSEKPVKGANTEASFIIIRQLFKNNRSRKKWYKDKNKYTISWHDKDGNKKSSRPINYNVIAQYLREKGGYNPDDLSLPQFECFWLDNSADISINFHKFDKGSKKALTISDGTPEKQFGEDYPIKPQIDREGHFFTTFQPQLIRRIINNRSKIIENSYNALDYEWILDLRSLINDTISLLEITLNQIYIKAQFDPLDDWEFDFYTLGDKHGRRLMDKMKWIRQLCGRNLDIEPERESLNRLRELRNHFNHFDPPSLVVTIEEAATWLNQIIDIGFILIKIRRTLKLDISKHLINFILQKKALFNPEEAFKNRIPLNSKVNGYLSSTWQE